MSRFVWYYAESSFEKCNDEGILIFLERDDTSLKFSGNFPTFLDFIFVVDLLEIENLTDFVRFYPFFKSWSDELSNLLRNYCSEELLKS